MSLASFLAAPHPARARLNRSLAVIGSGAASAAIVVVVNEFSGRQALLAALPAALASFALMESVDPLLTERWSNKELVR